MEDGNDQIWLPGCCEVDCVAECQDIDEIHLLSQDRAGVQTSVGHRERERADRDRLDKFTHNHRSVSK